MSPGRFSKDMLTIDPAAECRRIEEALRDQVFHQSRRKGAVVGVSGGIDSSVTAALCARALGADRTLALLMPERDSSPESLELGRKLALSLGIDAVIEDIGGVLDAAGCYRRRDAAIKTMIPEYGPQYKCKIVLEGLVDHKGYNVFHLVVEAPGGGQKRCRLDAKTYLGIVAATNMKQRTRKFFEYFHADRLNYVVAGTPNRLEYDQGFFVKNGDGAADVKPIAHLYKSQVYALAAYMNIPEEIQKRPPTTDTYSLAQSQEEFYFALPYREMDLCLYAKNQGVDPREAGEAIGIAADQVERIYADIDRKRAAARYLRSAPLLVEPV